MTASGYADNRILLNWTDESFSEDGFAIQWKSGAYPFTAVATVSANTVSYLHSANMAGERVYTYRVRAVRGAMYSDSSPEASSTDGH